MFRRLFWGSLVLAVPTVLLSQMFADPVGYQVPGLPGVFWLPPILGTVLYFWFGRPFLTGAVSEIRSRQPGMMLLVALAITVAFVASWGRSEEHTSELQSLMRISSAVFCLKHNINNKTYNRL